MHQAVGCLQALAFPYNCYAFTPLGSACRLLERQQSGQHASSSDDRRSRQQRALESAMLAAHGLMPGQSHTPARLGRDQHELTAERGDPGSLSAPGDAPPAAPSRAELLPPLPADAAGKPS